jgi:amino acid transporter
MRKLKFTTDFKIKLPIIIISLFIFIGILSYQFTSSNFYIISTIISFLTIIVAVFSIIGLFNAIKKIRNPTTVKRVFFVLLMAMFICTILYIIVENIMAAMKITI